MTLVSVVMPVYNAAPFLQASIESIAAQTEHDLELLVVDDGSTDESLQIARNLAAADTRITVIALPNSGGPSHPRNEGIRRATGEFIAFQDADDVSHPTRFARELEAFRRFPNAQYVFHDFSKFVNRPGEAARSQLQELEFLQRARDVLAEQSDGVYRVSAAFYKFLSLDVPVVSTCAVMFRRSLFDRISPWFREDLSIGEDYDLWFRLIRGREGAFVDEVLAFYRQHATNTTRNAEGMYLGGIHVHTANLERGNDEFTAEERRRYRQRIAALWFHLGVHHMREERKNLSRAAYLRSFRLASSSRTVLAFMKTLIPTVLIRRLRR